MPIFIRPSEPCDTDAMKNIWKLCFNDSDEYINGFFEKMYHPGEACVAETDGKITACAYCLKSHELVASKDETPIPCSYIYAVGTLPEFRSHGLGRAVTLGAVELGKSQGLPLSVICPAGSTLFDYYHDMGFKTAFSVSEYEFDAENIGSISPTAFTHKYLSAPEYCEEREKNLQGMPHLKVSIDTLEYLATAYRLVSFEHLGHNGLAAIELWDDTAYVKELLFDNIMTGVSILHGLTGTKRYIVRTLGKGRPFAMCYPDNQLEDSAYFGFALD